MKYLLLFILFAPSVTFASYYAQDYDPEYLPYNYEDAVDAEYDECNLVLDQYHDISTDLDQDIAEEKKNNSNTNRASYVIPWPERPYLNDVRVGSFTELKTVTEEQIRLCLIDFREYEEEQEQEEAEARAREEAKEEAQERLDEINNAIEECDFDFFNKMSTQEKMSTFDERKACEEKSQNIVNAPAATPSVPIVQTPILNPVVQTNAAPIPKAVTTEAQDNSYEEIKSDAVASSSDQKEDVVTMTQEEIDKMVEEKLNQKLDEVNSTQEQQPKPSFFKKITDFLFGWLF